MSKIYRVREFGERVGLAPITLRRWDASGRLPAKRLPSGHRYYDDSDVRTVLGVRDARPTPKRAVAYCRVSSAAQKPDLVNQRKTLELFCAARGIADVEWIQEVGGGLNFKRPKFVSLMDAISAHEVSVLVIAHKDRLARFGFDWFSHHCSQHDCELLVMNQETLSPDREMVEDLMAIVHCFSSRLYGLRNYRKALKAALSLEEK